VGPSFAEEVVNKKLTAVNVLCDNLTIGKKVASLFNNEYFKVTPLQDEIGGQVISALKNVLGIICGFVSTESANTKAAIFAQGVKEIQNIALSYGASQKTMMEFCGIGDIFLTCTDLKSRNFKFGISLREKNANSRSSLKKETIEGLNALPIVFKYIKLNKICSPLISETYKLIFTKYNKNNFVKNVLL
jgi:glycerol-3-phosphate dehydrogenase (NAD(P)+)